MKIATQIALIALLWIGVVNTGTLGSSDTDTRLQMAHAWWTGTPEVDLNFRPRIRGDLQSGLMGTGGKRYIFYDLGQSMLMLPADWLGTKLHQFTPKIPEIYLRRFVVNVLVFIPLNVALVVCCFYLLKLLNFRENIAAISSIVWLMGTTVLHYAQVHQQNNQVLLFTILSYTLSLAYLKYGKKLLAILSGLSIGAAFLIRTTSVVHVFTSFALLVACIGYQSRSPEKVFKSILLWIVGFLPLAILERTFAFLRYGSFLATGTSVFMQTQATDPVFAGLPELPVNYPLINPPQVGILGVLFSSGKSIFIYDPLLLPCILVSLFIWWRLSPYIKCYVITGIFNLCAFIFLMSRVEFWSGDAAWGARYHVTSVQILLIPLIAILVQNLQSANKIKKYLSCSLLSISILIQIFSICLPYHLEVSQNISRQIENHNSFVLQERVTNIICLANPSFSETCLEKALSNKNDDRFVFFPFNLSDKISSQAIIQIALIVWGLLLISAIISSMVFVFKQI